jgi:hypothetical protein
MEGDLFIAGNPNIRSSGRCLEVGIAVQRYHKSEEAAQPRDHDANCGPECDKENSK